MATNLPLNGLIDIGRKPTIAYIGRKPWKLPSGATGCDYIVWTEANSPGDVGCPTLKHAADFALEFNIEFRSLLGEEGFGDEWVQLDDKDWAMLRRLMRPKKSR